MTQRRVSISAVDLFCGAGGLTHGLSKAGIKVRIGVDIDPACQFPYTANNKAQFLLQSVSELSGEDLSQYYTAGSVRLLAGCAPCQTFSSYNQKASEEDDRWWLLRDFSRLVGEILPEIVTMENVVGLLDHKVFGEFESSLEGHGYEVMHQLVNCTDYGIPQHRTRLVLLASRLGPISLLPPKHLKKSQTSVWRAIGDMPELEAGGSDPDDPLHQSSTLSPLNMKRMKASKQGGTWRDWPEELVAECHRKRSGKTYPGVYGRMTKLDPAPTITTQFYGFGNGRFGHPTQDRAISLREGALLQSFPRTYQFVPEGQPVRMKVIGRLIGNAVPVALGKAIGQSISAHVKAHQEGLELGRISPA